MAVVGSANQVWDGWAASTQWGRKSDITVIYEIVVDDALDGPVIVDDAPGLPRLSDSYGSGNDSDPSSFCVRKSYSRKKDKVWRVTCTFGALDIGSPTGTISRGRDATGKPTDDPFAELLPFRTGQYTRSIPVMKAKNVDRVGSRWAMTEGPVTNSAGVVFDPPPEMDYSIMVLYITSRTLSVPDDIIPNYYNAVNEDVFEVARAGFRIAFEPFTVKCIDLGVAYMMKNNKTYWEFNLAFAVDHIFGWRPEFVDQGFTARAEVGDPDGRGSTILPGTIDDWAPKQRVLTDIDGHPLQEPVLLDGAGQPLPLDGDPVYLKYITYPELNFTNLSLVLLFAD